jgi:calcineurin-like phosphoesterase family protein
MNYWWTSDYHFSHFNIIKYCNRPFKTVEEMNEAIISKHNERVKPDDTVFFLGDFIFKGGNEGGVHRYQLFEKRLNGKFIFIRGNHDNNNSLKTIITKMYLYYGAKTICMTHKPEYADPSVPFNFCGHVHDKFKIKRLNENSFLINFSVDVWDFYPVSFKQVNVCVAEFLRKEKGQVN